MVFLQPEAAGLSYKPLVVLGIGTVCQADNRIRVGVDKSCTNLLCLTRHFCLSKPAPQSEHSNLPILAAKTPGNTEKHRTNKLIF